MTLRAPTVAVALLLGSAGGAIASEYPGWGDTGWVYASKRDCCNAAISIASQYSEQACMTAGGRPSPFAGGMQQGSCSSQWTQDADGNVLWRCYGESAIWCDQ